MNEPGPIEITSPENPAFKGWKRLLAPGGVHKEHRALVSGGKIVAEAIASLPGRCESWLTSGRGMPGPPPGLPGTSWHHLAPELFAILDSFGTRSPLLVVRVPELPRWRPEEGLPPGISLFLPFQDPENVGGALRSAVAFGVSRVVLLAGCAHPYHPKALRASAGAALRAPLARGPRMEDLPMDLPLVPLSQEGKDVALAELPVPGALLPGVEGSGLPEPWRVRGVAIPHRPDVDSLNAAAAVAIALYVWSQRLDGVSRSKGRSAASGGGPPRPRPRPRGGSSARPSPGGGPRRSGPRGGG
jgi:tRNA G18 (ribose-2'-O)-methylase SpoU